MIYSFHFIINLIEKSVLRIRFILMWIRIRVWIRGYFFWGTLITYYSCVYNKKVISKNKNIIIVFVDFYMRLSRFLIFQHGYASTFPEVDPDQANRPNDTDPKHCEN